jgi:linalool 8-monooxygenase/cholest-4-en-3-one 26-monooxygenase
VLFVSRHPELFSSAQGISGPGLRDPEAMPNVTTQPGGVSIITMDPPRHVKMRRLVNKGFTPRAVNAMEPLIRQITNTILDRIADRGACDFVLDVASQLPLAVICGLMGLEERHWPLMFQLTNRTLGATPSIRRMSSRRTSVAPWRRRRARPWPAGPR